MARTRYKLQGTQRPLRELPFAALRAVVAEGYTRSMLKVDLLAGVVVGMVALPLSMALSIGVGAPPQHGLYTAIVAGLFVALLGGSRTQVTGPTAAFIVILAPIYAKFGLGGLLLSGLMGGLMLILMGLLRLGRIIQFIPHPVTTGFTAGIATVIATLQLKDLFGLRFSGNPQHYLERVFAMFEARGTASAAELGVGLGTLAILIALPKLTRKIPAPLVALPVAAAAAALLGYLVPGFEVATISSRFHTEVGGVIVDGIPQLPPLPLFPWSAAGPDGRPLALSLDLLRELLPGAVAIAMLGAIESLLSAVVADGMANTRHDPDAELLALGVGNVLAPFFGGIPATGAIARTATNIRSGARSPVAAVTHALVVLAAVLLLAPLIGYLPMASLAGLLLLVAWNMSEVKHFRHTLKVAPKSDVAVLLTCYSLTVIFDMVVAVTVGIVLAALLFMRRMAEVTQARAAEVERQGRPASLAKGLLVYEISGPLFFGAAQKAMGALDIVGGGVRAVILRMERVPAMDATGLVALESVLARLKSQGCLALFAGLQPQPTQVLKKAHIADRPGEVLLFNNFDAALGAAEDFLGAPRSGLSAVAKPPAAPEPSASP
jgi:sulfate permease, SulP family